MPVSCFSMALATFVSQNIGARRYDRVRSGIRFGLLCSPLLAEAIGLGIFVSLPCWLPPSTAARRSSPTAWPTPGPSACSTSSWPSPTAVQAFSGDRAANHPHGYHAGHLVRPAHRLHHRRHHFIPDIRVIYWAYPLTWFLGGLLFAVCLLRLRFPSDAALETYK
ncbi:MAG: hypothetical protein ACLRIS_14340 [Flavonifractor plautii]